ncbi:MAG: hypothetical protein ABI680_11805 [Chthoniobacteraceae bacterium]
MGNSGANGKTLTLSKIGRPVILYTVAKTPGTTFFKALEPLDRKHASFVTKAAEGESPVWKLPPTWEGTAKGSSDGSIALDDGKPIWKLEQLWPADWMKPENFVPMVWTGTDWNVKEGGFGGQPGGSLKDGALSFGTRAPHGLDNDRHLRTAGLTFVAPKTGTYALHGNTSSRIWDGNNEMTLLVLKKTKSAVENVGSVNVPHKGEAALDGQVVALAAGEELTLLPQISGMFAGGSLNLKDFSITLGTGGAAPKAAGYRLPAAWEGEKKGGAAGNPIASGGQPIWRLDRLFPADPIMTSNYSPMVWSNGVRTAPDHTQGGHPSAKVEDGSVNFGALGPWGGNEFNFPKIPVLAFVAPKNGIYNVTGTAKSKPWDGNAKSIELTLRKKDTQRAVEVSSVSLPRDGTPVPFSAEVELNAGHELLFVPMMNDLHNNASNISIENLVIAEKR